MTWLRLAMLLLGLGLFAWVLQASDLAQVGGALAKLGLAGAAAVAAIYLLAFVVDTLSWQLALPITTGRTTGAAAGTGLRWLYRLWKVRMVGEAFNVALPTTVGGEPVKAVLLKRHYGVPFNQSGASLVIAKTVNLLALVGFALIGLIAMLAVDVLSHAHDVVAVAGLAALALGSFGFFAVQRWRVASQLAHLLARWRQARRLEAVLEQIDAVEGHFHEFYVRRPGRFAAALALAFLNWCLGAAELWLIMALLGHPQSWGEAWMLAALIELVRAGTFFIPASLGATELAFVLIVEALSGQAALGLAVSLVRRAREILWIAWGLSLGWSFSALRAATDARPAAVSPATAEVPAAKQDR
ncbi:MAG: lysylphosphatidylglycerol synthase transmembrane domain-containing protein [Kiloniellales bacterium]